MRWDDIVTTYREHELTVWVFTVATIVLTLVLGSVLYPDVFWDGFLYRYFWGPIVSDQAGERVDVAEGYNIVNTVVYAVILVVSLMALLRLFKRIRVPFDSNMALACIPLFIFGGTARALEDAALFSGDLALWFISPLIYVLVIAMFLVAIGLGLIMRSLPRWAWTVVAIALVVSTLTFEFIFQADLSCTVGPFAASVAGVASIIAYGSSRRWDDVHASLLSVGVFLLSLTLVSLFAFTQDADWIAHYVDVSGDPPDPRYLEALVIPALASIGVIAAYAIGRIWPSTRFAERLNLMMFAGHMLDGTATYRGIELYGYSEKHVLPRFLIDSTGTAAVMLPMKFLMVAVVVYVLDVLLREDLEGNRDLVTALKFVIVFLGLAPGVRDMVRIAMGV